MAAQAQEQMNAPGKMLAAGVATLASAAILATVREGWLDAADCVVLVASLTALVRIAIRVASQPDDVRRFRP
jgi:hypothetical protein